MLLERLEALLSRTFSAVFSRRESRQRAAKHALSLLLTIGRRTITRVICTSGEKDRTDWSAEYKLFSRSPWKTEGVFDPVIEEWLERTPQGPVVVAIDDTPLPRTGAKVFGVRWLRDPLSPPFHVNFMRGLRMLHAALVFSHYREGVDVGARSVPVRFQLAPCIKKPGKKASAEERASYAKATKADNLSLRTIDMTDELRRRLDRHGANQRTLLAVGDGGFCNRTVFRAQ